MTEIVKTALTPYSAEQMYNLVNDIESYPDFLPWCSDAKLLEAETNRLTATVTIQSGKIHQSFTTENSMQPGNMIEVRLVKGPFKRLHGTWQFDAKDDDSCLVTLKMNFEFKNKLIKMALSTTFNRIINNLVDAFIKRAHQLYG